MFWHIEQGGEMLAERGLKLAEQRTPTGKTKLDCFACGSARDVERCHIVARTAGGSDDVSNLHLLCAKCHRESEMLDGDLYWRWLQHMIATEWRPYGEHSWELLEKLGFQDADFLDAWRQGGQACALRYLATFVNADEREGFIEFMTGEIERLGELDQS